MDDDRLSDEQLIAKIAGRDAQALAALYDRYSPAVLTVALLVVREPQRAEEVVAQAFWDLWKQRGMLPVEGQSVRNRLMLYTRRLAQDALVGSNR